jgi:hypothetical protein
MANPKIQIGNTVRQMTADEITEHDAYKQEQEQILLAQKLKMQAIFDKLGLTDDEVKALFG